MVYDKIYARYTDEEILIDIISCEEIQRLERLGIPIEEIYRKILGIEVKTRCGKVG